MNEKLRLLESLDSPEQLERIITNLLKAMNVSDIHTGSNYISGGMSSPIGQLKIAIFYTIDHLGRNYHNYNDFIKDVINKITGGNFNSIVVASSKNITEGFKERVSKDIQITAIDYWDRDTLLRKIDESFSEFWRHDDQDLITYEKQFQEELNNDWSINKIKQFRGAHEKLLKIFIEPRLLHKVTDHESPKKALVKIGYDELRRFGCPVMLQGEPGIGKTRILKQIGMEFINLNTNKSQNRHLPVLLNNIDLIETRKKNSSDLIDIRKAADNKIGQYLKSLTLDAAMEKYTVVLLIDSIDDFNRENQLKLLNDLKSMKSENLKIFFGSRYFEYSSIAGFSDFGKCEEVYVEKFPDSQIKLFLSAYFKNDKNKAENLLDSLKENAIIQRLPITPLNLSLISILYEENNFEIPATITDIYDNFSNLLLGRTLPDSKFDFFDITIRERILSVYALELLKRGERSYMSKDDFKLFFAEFFARVQGTINLELLPDALDFLINNTGILVLQDGQYVKFMHESYMEYYASREIFNYKRDEESLLVSNFLETSWQYATIFYAGRTKEMNGLLSALIDRAKKANKSHEFYRAVHGLGYVSQALYMSDDLLRKQAVDQALVCAIELYELMKKLGSDEKLFFKNISMPLAAVINSMIFFDGFNSITLRKPLELSFEELIKKIELKVENRVVLDYNVAYKLFTIALTLSSPRLENIEPMKRLIYNTSILNDPLFERLLDFGLSVAGSKALHDLKDNFKRPKRQKGSDIAQFNRKAEDFYLNTPLGRIRFSHYDRIYPERKVLLLTEGKTDAQIIEHAYMTLTGQVPYWEINPVHELNGGANALAKALENGAPYMELSKAKVIGLFDNDEKGVQEFNGQLKSTKFEYFQGSHRIKKFIGQDIYGVKLPIPPVRSNYYQEDQKFNFFSIEHYFDDSLLEQQKMLVKTPIPRIFSISEKGTAKTDFSKYVRSLENIDVFKHFVHLFREIDAICGRDDVVYQVD